MAMEQRVGSRIRTSKSICRLMRAAWLILVLTSAGRAQEVPAGPLPVAGEAAAGEGAAEEPSAAEAIDAEDFIETDRNSFTFARMTAGANRLIVESSFSYINLTGEKVSFSFPETLAEVRHRRSIRAAAGVELRDGPGAGARHGHHRRVLRRQCRAADVLRIQGGRDQAVGVDTRQRVASAGPYAHRRAAVGFAAPHGVRRGLETAQSLGIRCGDAVRDRQGRRGRHTGSSPRRPC